MELGWLTLLHKETLIIAYTLSVVAVGHVLLNKGNPRSALAWTLAIIFLPWIGVILYSIFGIARVESRAAQFMRKAKIQESLNSSSLLDEHINAPPLGHVRSRYIPQRFLTMSSIGRKLTNQALCGGNAINPLYNGDSAYPLMIDAIEKAHDYVYLTTFIFNGGKNGELFVKALDDAANRGVDVRLLVDGVGQRYSWSRPWRKLQNSNVKMSLFLPPRLYPPNFSINLRNHRKVLVADSLGFTGGMNIADYHDQSHADFAVQDIHFICSGPIVSQLRDAFLLDWAFCTNDYSTSAYKEEEMCGDILCRMVLDGPGSGKDPLHELLYGAIGAAQKSVCIMTPYFLPSHEVTAALKAASLRGVQVQIILPAKNNIRMIHWATFHLLPTFLEAGVHIFYQDPPFSHAKLFIIDDYYVQIGSTNFDPRSLRLNFELNVECFDTSFARQMRTYFNISHEKGYEYTLENVKNQPLAKRLLHAFAWLFSPYL